MHRVAGLFNGEWSSQETEDLLLGEVTHWMPLPAAPATHDKQSGEVKPLHRSTARAPRQRTQSAPVSQAERLPLESLEPLKRPVPSGWAVKRSDASRHELYGFYDEYLGPLDGWLQDPRRAVLFGNKEAAIAAQAALSVGSKLAISVVWLVYDPVFDTYREQAQ